MANESQNQTWLDNLNPLKITEDSKVKDAFISVVNKIHKKSIDEAIMIYEKESLYFKKALAANDKLKNCTKISLYSAFTEIAIQGISIQPGQKSEAYLEARGVNIGTRQQPQYIDTCMLRITAYGELNMRITSGQIIRMKNPIVLYDGDHFQPLTNQRGELYVDYKPAIPRKSQKIYGAWVCIELPGDSLDFKWLLDDDIARLMNYSIPKFGTERGNPNALYTANGGQIDPGFLEAKTIKHAMRAYTKLRVSDVAAFEDEGDPETPEAFGDNHNTPAAAPKNTVSVEINKDEPF
ncbi:MAG: hypothetical protein JZU65_19470 [Chlorobium sp.]|jgi:hypothetical protein|nr:hypothetical protein [Chlorobium sp.]